MRRTFLMFVLFFVITQTYSQFLISGTVRDEGGSLLAGTNVLILDSFLGTITPASGEFEFPNLLEGTYILKFSYIGYESIVKEIILEEDVKIEILMKKAPYLMDEIMIKAIRAGEKDPVALDMISREEIESKNFGQDIPTLLSLSPSLVSTSDAGHGIGYSSFRIRGTDANRINITVDGIPLNDSESHGVWWVNMPDLATSVKDVQIQRGVGTSSNGAAAFGASVNFQTLGLQEEAYAQLDAGYGSFNTYKTSISAGTGLIDDHFSFNLRLSDIHSDGYIDRARSDLKSYYFSAAYQNEKTLIKFKNFAGIEEVYQSWGGISSQMLDENRTYNPMGEYTNLLGQTKYYDNQIDHYEQEHYHLSVSNYLSSSLSINTAVHYTKGSGYYEEYKESADLQYYKIDYPSIGNELIKNTDLIRQKCLSNDFYGLVFSLNYQKDRYNGSLGGSMNNYVGDHYGEVIWANFPGSSEKGHRWYENTGTKPEYNIYTKLNYNLSSSLNAYGDLQFRKIDYEIVGFDDDSRDIRQEHHFSFLNPKIGLNFRPNPQNRLYVSFSIANREPNRSNFVDADPNQAVPSFETLYDYEMGYQLSGDYFKSELNFYFMDYDNQLVLTGEINDVGAPVMTNVKDSYRAGLEFSTAITLGKHIEWQGNMTLSRNKIKNMLTYVDNWSYWDDPSTEVYQYESELDNSDIAFSPSLTAGSFFTISPTNDLDISIQSKFVSKQYIDNTSSDERALDSWFVNDLILNYQLNTKVTKEIDFKFMIVNLFNYLYESNAWVYRYYYEGSEQAMTGLYPQAGIHFMSGVSVKF